jgi:hypothetical protein
MIKFKDKSHIENLVIRIYGLKGESIVLNFIMIVDCESLSSCFG